MKHDGQLVTRFYDMTSWLCDELTGYRTRDVDMFYEVVLYNERFRNLSEDMTKKQTCVTVEFNVPGKARSTRHNAVKHDGQLVTQFYDMTSWPCDELTGSRTRDVDMFYEVVLYNERFRNLSEDMTKKQTCVIVEFNVL